jgi:hypothetical protein
MILTFTSFVGTLSTSHSIWACCQVLLKIDYKFNCILFFEGRIHIATWLKTPKGWMAFYQEQSSFVVHRLLDFHIFFKKNCSWFRKISSSIRFNMVQSFNLTENSSIFVKYFIESIVFTFSFKSPINKRILLPSFTNLRVGLEPWLVNLI